MNHTDVHDKASFTRYVASLIAELDDPVESRQWENTDVRSLLEAMEAWASDTEQPADPNPWRHAAEVLKAARMYE